MTETIKLRWKTVDALRKMNSSYPSSTVDYDDIFLRMLLEEVFTKNELRLCGEEKKISSLNEVKRKFVKGINI